MNDRNNNKRAQKSNELLYFNDNPKDTSALRTEIIESQKARIDLLKYKLLAVATLGAIGLGFGQSQHGKIDSDLVLLIIPLVCIYIDLLCWHNTLRILVIGRFLSHYHKDLYEKYISSLDRYTPKKGYFYELEDFALSWSTILVSFLLIIYPIIIKHNLPKISLFFICGSVGIVLSIIFLNYYKRHISLLFNLSNNVLNTTNMIIHNEHIKKFIKDNYSLEEIRQITSYLYGRGCFIFSAFINGLFPAAHLTKDKEYSGYSNVWIRDNIYIAYSHYMCNQRSIAAENIKTIMAYFKRHQDRFIRIIKDEVDPQNPMMRPHVRFNGSNLKEIQEKWAHAQNDALGYFLWFYCLLVNQKSIIPQQEDLKMLALFVLYFQKISYWEDEDSGHWEEIRKISASSIGVVVAALKELKKLIAKQSNYNCQYESTPITDDLLTFLINKGENALAAILPSECIQNDPKKRRRYDAALLFLIYPLEVVRKADADQILQDVINNLQGEYGIRRYLGDSYWAPDYKKRLRAEERTIDFSDDMSLRNALLPHEGLEAQWCIFDPIISIIYGKRFQKNGKKEDLLYQTMYLNRALGQITGVKPNVPAFKCPELYYLEDGQYAPNDHVPLFWTQANLMLALKEMENSLLCES